MCVRGGVRVQRKTRFDMDLRSAIQRVLARGVVIPAHPLALDVQRRLDERRQRALSRYYIAAGAGGLAVGVHTTQFEIRQPQVGLFRPVLELAREEMDRADATRAEPLVRVAGICGPTPQAVAEAAMIRELGYHAGLLSLAALRAADDAALLAHCRAVAEIVPARRLLPAAGGRRAGPFLRLLAAVRGDRERRGDQDRPLQSLPDPGRRAGGGRVGPRRRRALHGQRRQHRARPAHALPLPLRGADGSSAASWAGCWATGRSGPAGPSNCWKSATAWQPTVHERSLPPCCSATVEVTDCNAALFDAANAFAGCICGIHEVLRRQGLLPGTWCLNPKEQLSPGQAEEIDRVAAAYPHLTDDAFVAEHLSEWL